MINIILDIIGLTMIVFSISAIYAITESAVGVDDDTSVISFIGSAVLFFLVLIPFVGFGYLGWFIFSL